MKKTKKTASSTAVQVGPHFISHEHPIFITAEIGINHNGDLELVKKLIDIAAAAGCNAVKFQKRTVPVIYSEEELARPRAVDKTILENALRRGILSKEAERRLKRSNFQESTNGDLKWALELTKDEYKKIDSYCKKKKIIWFASCWDENSVDFMEDFNPPAYKVASASLTDHGLMRHMRKTGRPIILSTGMSDLNLVRMAVNAIGKKDLVLLHSISTYPATVEELNLMAIPTLRQEFGLPIGYSGHEVGLIAAVAAAVLGACVIERHITLDRAMWGTDQAASVEPGGLERLVAYIREWEKAKGDGIKRIWDSEKPIMAKLRRK